MHLGSYIWFRAKIAAGLPFEGVLGCWGVASVTDGAAPPTQEGAGEGPFFRE